MDVHSYHLFGNVQLSLCHNGTSVIECTIKQGHPVCPQMRHFSMHIMQIIDREMFINKTNVQFKISPWEIGLTTDGS